MRWLILAVFALPLAVSFGQNPPRVTLDTSESVFTALTAINACGYDQELEASNPLRSQIRSEVAKAVQASEDSKEATGLMCTFYRDHQQTDPAMDLAPYVSLALYLNGPSFALKVKEGELPPDASQVAGMVPLMQKFFGTTGLHRIWERHKEAYAAFPERYHQPVAKMLFDTEVYLKMLTSAYLGRQFTVFLEPMAPPSQVNARSYGSDYYVVIAPAGSSLKMQEIRHTYLHYLLDPLAMKNGSAVLRLQPLLDAVKTAPLDESFRKDTSLLVTECLVRAIEARTTPKMSDAERTRAVDESVREGFILTSYFYDALPQFEKDPAGMRSAYRDLLNRIDIKKEMKQAAHIQFASKAAPELLHFSRPGDDHLLLTAEKRLSAGDAQSAQKLAQQALDENREDRGRALFILAQVATMNRDMQGARNYFERALEAAQEPKVVVWSHIYLGRIFDLQENREAALDHYRAALTASGALPEAKAAAERGLQQPYEPPQHAQ